MFGGIRDRVAARDYLDTVLGIPQEGGNFWVGSPAPLSRRSYRRGAPEYVQARREGLIEPLPTLVAATTSGPGRVLPSPLERAPRPAQRASRHGRP